MNICSECKKPINGGVFIGTINGGVAHEVCYHIANPPKIRETFPEVLVNCDDQVLVRKLLIQHVSDETQKVIISEFNQYMNIRHQNLISQTALKEY